MSGCVLSAYLCASAALTAQSASLCDRACLEGFIDLYVDALVARDPSRLPVRPTLKFTENGQRLDIGDGLWNTVTGKGVYALRIADVEAGQVALMGTIREADTPAIFVLRLKIVAQRISEVETLVIRNQAVAESLDRVGAPRRLLLESLPESERLSRDDLARVANMYFSGLELNDGRGVYPFWDTCARLENGAVTAGDPAAVIGAAATGREAAAAAPTRDGPTAPRMNCRQQFETGMFHYVTRIRDRRFVVLDRERGIAFAFVFFDNASGDARHVTLSDGRKVVSGPSFPWTWQIAELFKVEQRRIRAVESVLHPVPYGMDSGWSTWEDAMSSQPRW